MRRFWSIPVQREATPDAKSTLPAQGGSRSEIPPVRRQASVVLQEWLAAGPSSRDSARMSPSMPRTPAQPTHGQAEEAFYDRLMKGNRSGRFRALGKPSLPSRSRGRRWDRHAPIKSRVRPTSHSLSRRCCRPPGATRDKYTDPPRNPRCVQIKQNPTVPTRWREMLRAPVPDDQAYCEFRQVSFKNRANVGTEPWVRGAAGESGRAAFRAVPVAGTRRRSFAENPSRRSQPSEGARVSVNGTNFRCHEFATIDVLHAHGERRSYCIPSPNERPYLGNALQAGTLPPAPLPW